MAFSVYRSSNVAWWSGACVMLCAWDERREKDSSVDNFALCPSILPSSCAWPGRDGTVVVPTQPLSRWPFCYLASLSFGRNHCWKTISAYVSYIVYTRNGLRVVIKANHLSVGTSRNNQYQFEP